MSDSTPADLVPTITAPLAVPPPTVGGSDSAPPTAVVNRIIGHVGPVPLTRRPNVAILGFTEHRKLAPFGDPSFEIWGLNELYRYMDVKQFTRWFEIHDRAYFEKNDPEHLKTLGAMTGLPIYMQRHEPDIPCSVPLPKAEIEAACGTYMTSSISWMLGLAILEGFEAIHVYGVDLAQETEYFQQRPGCEYLLGVAVGRGIRIYVPPTSDLLKSVGQYAFGNTASEFAAKLQEREEWLRRERQNVLNKIADVEKQYGAKRGELDGQYNALKAEGLKQLHSLEGAIDDNIYWKRSWAVSGVNPSGGTPHPDRGEPKLPEHAGKGSN